MPRRTTAFFVRRNEIREEETTGEVQQQGTDAIQRHPFVTANCCAVGWGSQGEGLLLMWTVFMKAAQVPVALERRKFFLLDGVLFLQCSPEAQVQSIPVTRDPPELGAKRHHFILLTKKVRYCSHRRAHSYSDTRCCILTPYLTVALPWVQSGDAPGEAYRVQTHGPSESTWRRYPGRVALQGGRSWSKLWGRTYQVYASPGSPDG